MILPRAGLLLLGLLAGWASFGQPEAIKVATLKYGGGGDWYANPTGLPNLLKYISQHTRAQVAPEPDVVAPGSPQIFQYPVVYMTGHGNVVFSPAELENLRTYLLAGGLLFADDNYGLQPHIRREIQRLFPEEELVEIPHDHPVYRQHFVFEQGIPKIHQHDGKPAQAFGIVKDGRLLVYLTFEADLGDGWEDPSVHSNPMAVRELALQMGTNVLLYAFSY